MSGRVLILSIPLGMGGIRSGDAIAQALHGLESNLHVRSANVLDYATGPARERFGKAYLDMIERAPHIIGYFYSLTDLSGSDLSEVASFPHVLGYFHDLIPSSHVEDASCAVDRIAGKLDLEPLRQFLVEERPDMIVNTHNFPARVVARLRQENCVTVPQCTVTHDFEVHKSWMQIPCEHYFVASEEGANALGVLGVPQSAITVSGIPIDQEFAQPKNMLTARKTLGLLANRPLILLMAGGLALGPVAEIFQNILAVKHRLQIVVITGSNEKLQRELETIPIPDRHAATILGYTQQVAEYLAAADLIVTKPGGLTSSEALARGTPIVIVNPIPGHESRNSDFLLERGVAVKVNNLKLLQFKLTELLDDPHRLITMRSAAMKLAKPDAARVVAKKILAMMDN